MARPSPNRGESLICSASEFKHLKDESNDLGDTQGIAGTNPLDIHSGRSDVERVTTNEIKQAFRKAIRKRK